MLHLVHHGRALVEQGVPPSAAELDPAGFDEVWALRESGRLPATARWFCAPEPVCIATAQLLTEGDVGVLDALRHPGDDPLGVVRERVVGVVTALLAEDPGSDLVLIGYADVWSVLGMPDAIVVDLPLASS